MRCILILSIFLICCSKEEEAIIKKPYQLEMAWEGTGYGWGTKDMLWTKTVNLDNKILIDMNPVYKSQDTNFQTFDIDITKLSDTNDIRVILTFDCDTSNIPHETFGFVRDNIPDYFDIKEEVLVNFYDDKRTVIQVSPSSNANCIPDIRVFYE